MATAFLFALALVAQDAPMATSTPAAQAAPPRPAAASSAPSDEYGYIGWCYGALAGYIDLYDQVMPEVTRIEKAFPGPSGVEEALKTYPEMRDQARGDLKVYRAAIVAAEKASPRPISEYGGAAIKKGRLVWAGSDQANKARLAQVWMSWSPPGDCESRARALEKKSILLGQALHYNMKKDAPPAPPPAEPEAPAAVAAPEPAETPAPAAPDAAPEAVLEATSPPAEAEAAPPPEPPPTKPAVKTPVAAKPALKAKTVTETLVDPADPQPCAGSLVPTKRDGKDVLVCRAD
jgi:hypothetical protein